MPSAVPVASEGVERTEPDQYALDSPMTMKLTERQATTVATAVTLVAALVIILAAVGTFWLIAYFLRAFSGVFLPLAVGAVAALVCQPYYQWLRSKARLPRALALIAVMLSFVLPVGAFLAFFGTILVHQVVEVVARFPEWWTSASSSLRERWPELREFLETPLGVRIKEALVGMEEDILTSLGGVSGSALSAGAGVVRGIGGLLGWAVLPVYFVFFLMVEPRAVEPADVLPFLKTETRKDVVYLVREFVDIIVAFFRGQLIIAFLQGLLFAIGFSLVGLRYGFVIGLLLGFLNVIPYLGSIVGLGIALPLALFQEGGGWPKVALVLSVFLLVQLVEAYVLTPRIMGERTGLHPLAIIVAVFFWGQALGGILGMIFAIPLTAFLASLLRLVREKYVTELV
jgi:predicted PurR-regulated permease PerM